MYITNMVQLIAMEKGPTTGGKSLEKIREVLEQKPKKKKRAAQERVSNLVKEKLRI